MITFEDLATEPIYRLLDRIRAGEEAENPILYSEETKEMINNYREVMKWAEDLFCISGFYKR